jgi:hypothetical protein
MIKLLLLRCAVGRGTFSVYLSQQMLKAACIHNTMSTLSTSTASQLTLYMNDTSQTSIHVRHLSEEADAQIDGPRMCAVEHAKSNYMPQCRYLCIFMLI